jgi:oxalate decarboxylase
MSIKTNNKKEQTISNENGEPIRGTWGAPILGPRNVALERENPDLLASPETDAGTVPNLKFSYSAARNRLASGGWAREVTVRELPVATKMADVNMRIRNRAYEIYLQRGAQPGYEVQGEPHGGYRHV